MFYRIALPIFVVLCFCISAAAQDFRLVDRTAPGTPADGDTWEYAYRTVQEAINELDGPGGYVLVAQGSYTPITTTGETEYYPLFGTVTDRNKVIRLKFGVHLRGGYLGWNGGTPGSDEINEPDGSFDATILSGDIGTAGSMSDNSYHVLVADGNPAPTTSIYGFRITRGFADDDGNQGKGAGLLAPEGFPNLDIRHCTFRENFAEDEGGAIYAAPGNGSIQLGFSTLHDNYADKGGAIYFLKGRNLILGNVEFYDNGSKLFIDPEDPTISSAGGAIYFEDERLIVASKAVFHDNLADEGAAVYVAAGPTTTGGPYTMTWVNSTFAFNAASEGSTYYLEARGSYSSVYDNLFLNVIFWDGDDTSNPDIYVGSNMKAILDYTNWDGVTAGSGTYEEPSSGANNLHVDPVFKNPATRNLRLNNVLGNVSPCRDEGSSSYLAESPDHFDLDADDDVDEDLPMDFVLNGRAWGGTPDMGAYEITTIVIP